MPVSRSRLMRQRVRSAWLFLAPMLLVLAAVAGWPLLRTFYYSFTDASLADLDARQWIGFDNYFSVLSMPSGRVLYDGLLADPVWWRAVWNTLLFAVVSVGCETVLGMIVALVLNADFRGRGIVRAAILIPWAIPTIVSAKMWQWMLNDQFGIINAVLLKLGLIDAKIAWTASTDTAMIAVLIVDIWKTTPFMALLFLAALQMLPRDVIEVARLDGANPWQIFWKVTLPLIRPAVMVAVIFRALDALRIFDLIYVLTPNNVHTKSMSVFVRENLFEFDKFAYGSAASTLLFLIVALLTISYIRIGRIELEGGR
ncbi:sugar ABC transporter permease [Mesorhizobium sp. M1A.F.Ca.IN.020.06.1.1]|uniref:carbohydrate ABC transporter permease n=1 Tax=unclassified Mesorhizobium TaxID=325217 RepID=UPI000BAED062|nr:MULTISPECIES: sugar ABC transporter permease [unclassified Mesorhizobium]PBB35957.1 sugar ABC transporter permease [Mesorhizobium sp. WSM3882]RUV06350.1 sugar ABC transporter permease [Mesorhizobium sp. M1A.F.Ca.IN.020.03.2.1]RUV87154.1 sugar ABC transporter permease [Mesorhizobium sp. M1A.F.Ca.IN.020.32.1.1]RUW08314.1 sugar ABC transporter permease [Mesorhizobium sp. M1A.F.Ca.IN.022.05.2.1]RUW20252.1 sugar ABC transporter permease [Mesorhizobium sp. M1A.F.Ca.IN.020.06.1.1]